MNVNCQSCGAKYAIADNKVQGRKVKVRCKSCSTTIVVDGTAFNAEAGVEIGNVVPDPKTLDGSELSPFVGDGVMWSVSITDDDQREMTADQIISAFKNGQFNDATFIWKEGMDDWKPLLDVPEFQSLRAPAPAPKPVAAGIPRPAAAGVQAAAQPAAFPPAPAAFPASPAAATPAAAAAPAGKGALPQAPGRISTLPQSPARASTLPRPRISNTKDLFSTAGAAEEEIATAPAPQVSNSSDATGSRNESSVLFSLDALKRQSTAPPAPSKVKSDDPFGLGNLGSGGGGLGGFGGGGSLFTPDAHALLTAPAAAPPPSAPIARPGAPAAFDVAPMPQKKKSPLIWVIAGVAVVAVAGGAFAMFGGKSESPTAESGEASASNAGDSANKASEEAKAKADEEKKAEEAKGSAGTAAPSSGTTKAAAPGGGDRASTTSPAATAAAASPKAGKPKVEEASSAGGGSTFNVGAAKAALAAAAGQAPSCKKSGQGGSGKATVTFSPSGGVSSVTISGISGFASNCVSGLFRKARVPAFSGAPVTVSKGFKIPE
ncbi:MAG: zinc-ribbon domain-containing protein [Polyangiaceae bacterium]|nr:zinc-ribbon domain-containing protein [Polyangiaceae bacterium]